MSEKMTITVEVSKAPYYILREAVGDGHCDGYEFGYCTTVPDSSCYITVDGEAYIVKASDIICAVIGKHIKRKLAENGD
jgi:hypothetical protein